MNALRSGLFSSHPISSPPISAWTKLVEKYPIRSCDSLQSNAVSPTNSSHCAKRAVGNINGILEYSDFEALTGKLSHSAAAFKQKTANVSVDALRRSSLANNAELLAGLLQFAFSQRSTTASALFNYRFPIKLRAFDKSQLSHWLLKCKRIVGIGTYVQHQSGKTHQTLALK